MSKFLYLTTECKDSWQEYEKSKDVAVLEKCISLTDTTYTKNKLFNDECVIKMKKAEKYYDKIYNKEKANELLNKLDEYKKLNGEIVEEIKEDLNKMFNLQRNTIENLCDCVSISLYTTGDNKSMTDDFRLDLGKLIMYLSSIYISIETIKKYTSYVVRLYLDVGTLQIVFDLVNERNIFSELDERGIKKYGGAQIVKVDPRLKTLTNCKKTLVNLLNSILTCDIVEPHILFCKKRMNDENYINGKLRLYRYSGFTDDSVRINASREADGCISLFDCHNLNLFSNKNLIMYNTTNTKEQYYWSDYNTDSCWTDIYDSYNTKFNSTMIYLDTDQLIKNIVSNANARGKSLDLVENNISLFGDNKFLYRIKNIVAPIWAGMICFGFQLNINKFNKDSKKINNLINKTKNELNHVRGELNRLTDESETLFKKLSSVGYFEKIGYFKKEYKPLKEINIKIEDIKKEFRMEVGDRFYVDRSNDYSISEKFSFVNTGIKRKFVLEKYKYIEKNLDTEDREMRNMMTPPLDTPEYEAMLIEQEKKKELGKIFDETFGEFEKEEKKNFFTVLNELLELAEKNVDLVSDENKYYKNLQLVNLYWPICEKIKNDIDSLNIGFDEILMYKYFKNIILFTNNDNSITKLTILNNISFNFSYNNRLKFLLDTIDEHLKNNITPYFANYFTIDNGTYDNFENMDKYIESISIQKKTIEEENEQMIKYNSNIDIAPYYYNLYVYDFFTNSDKFKKFFKELTGEDYIENTLEQLVYNITGGKINKKYVILQKKLNF